MAVLGMNFKQCATLLNSIVAQATGTAQITPTNTSEFISVAQTGLKTGYDPLMNAISQVLSKTIFSVRPYSAKFKGLMADSVRYGNHVRKIQLADKAWEEDDRIKPADGYSIDQYVVNKPQPLQTNFYGENVFQKSVTIFRDQLDVAFSGPEEFSRFIGMVMQNATDMLEQAREDMARMALTNFIAGKTICDSSNVVYLLDKYEDETGLTGLTTETIKQPENFAPFTRWMFGYLKTLTDLLTERSTFFHKNYTIKGVPYNINRHTPIKNQKCYLYARDINNMDANVLSTTFHDLYLKGLDFEAVNFWQSIDTPMGIQVTPGYTDTDGTQVTSPNQVTLSNVLGVIFDEEAIGVTRVNQWSASSPFNAKGGYSNTFWHETMRWWNDFSENGVVLILDHSENALEVVQVTSVAGTGSGDTKITIDPAATGRQALYYKTGTDAAGESVTYGMDVSDWASWDGSADITPGVGDTYITIVIANSEDKAIGAGHAEIVAAV